MNGLVILITGASSGIGQATARLCARNGAKLSLFARRAERLQQLQDELRALGSEVQVTAGDITDHAAVERWIRQTEEAFQRIDVLVNNAGVGCVGRIADARMDLLRQVMEVNYFGALAAIQAVVPIMRKQRKGHIINVSSIIGKRSIPDLGGYCASKFALQAAGDALRLEVAEKGIAVTTLCPGLTSTEFVENQLRPNHTPPLRAKGMKGHTPEDVAKAIVRAIERKPRDVRLTAGGRFLLAIERISPSIVDRMLGLRHHFVKN